MSNIAPDKKLCRVHCPTGNHAYGSYGEVIECEHGALFMIVVPYVKWPTRYLRYNFERLSPIWTPIKWRRAKAARAAESEEDTP